MVKYKKIGLKLTPQRLAILNYLEENTSHPSAEDVYRAVSDHHPTMSFATVYKTLDTLKEKGFVVQLSIDPEKKRFDPCTDHHHHLICTSCRKVMDVKLTYMLDLPEQFRGDFSITGNHIEFYGVCSACRSRQ